MITKPQDLCIGQLYMYKKYNELERGFCKKIEEDKVTFRRERGWTDEIKFIANHYPQIEFSWIAEYNARVFRRYKKLQEQYEKELEECLNGKSVYVAEISKKKWYERFLRRKNV